MATNIINGTTDNDVLMGTKGSDSILGNGGTDTIIAGNGDDTIDAGYGSSGTVIEGGEGNNIIFAYDDVTVRVGNGDNNISCNSGDIKTGDGNNYILIGGTNNILTGAGNDTVNMYSTSIQDGSTIKLGAGDDSIESLGGHYEVVREDPVKNVTIEGGTGNDTIRMDYLNAYEASMVNLVFNLGDGQDTVIDRGSHTLTTIMLGDGISLDMLEFIHEYDNDSKNTNLVIKIGSNGDLITLTDYLAGYMSGGNTYRLQFNDGTVIEDIRNLIPTIDSNATDDFTGTNLNDKIIADSNHNYISDSWGTNYIDAGEGNDTIAAGKGTIIGGKGNDEIFIGSTGSRGGYFEVDEVFDTTVVFNVGDGQDTIYNQAFNDAKQGDIILFEGTQTIKFGDGITADMISFKVDDQNPRDVIISIGENDSITLRDYIIDDNLAVQYRFEFTDGTVWLSNGILGRDPVIVTPSIEGTSEVDVYGIWGGSRTFNSGAGNDSFFGLYGNNTLYGGDGDDLFSVGDYINAGDYPVNQFDGEWNEFSKANITGGKGNDTYDFSRAVEGIGGFHATLNYNLGDGQDTIVDGFMGTRPNTDNLLCDIKFGRGITKDMLNYSYQYSEDEWGETICELVIKIGKSGDQITIKNIPYYVDENGNTVFEGAKYTLEFADGAVINDLYQFIGEPSEQGDFDNIIKGTDKNDRLTGSQGNDSITGGAGNDIITDNYGQNYLDGGEGNDRITGVGTLKGGAGNDTLTGRGVFEGGANNDLITANIKGSSDTFIFNKGDGQDTIASVDTAKVGEKGSDTLILNGINQADVIYQRQGNHLILTFTGSDDKITLTNYFAGVNNQTLDTIQFADGNYNLKENGIPLTGTDKNDNITGGLGNDTIRGLAGNDVITDNQGVNLLDGGEGSDRITGVGTLKGGAGNDTLTGSGQFEGGQGKDVINAKVSGSKDLFIFNAGDGQDTINCQDSAKVGEKGSDTLILNGINQADVIYQRQGNHLILTFTGNDDKITLTNYFAGVNNQTLDTIQFADGNYSLKENGIPLTGTDKNNNITGGLGNDTIRGLAGNDVITDNQGVNLLDGGEGNDRITGVGTLKGGAGNDTLTGSGVFEGGANNDLITANIKGSSDTFIFNKGDGQDTITSVDTAKVGEKGSDTLILNGINQADVIYQRQGNHLILTFTGSDDKITLTNYFAGVNNQTLDTIQFADGNYNLKENGIPLTGTDKNDNITGGLGNDTIRGLAGNDVITDNQGVNLLDGGEGHDRITGTGTLVGGSGNDSLTGSGQFEGGQGKDVINAKVSGSKDLFIFNAGDGQDTINCQDTAKEKAVDTLYFKDINSDEVTWVRKANNLVFTVEGSEDQITLTNYFAGANYQTVKLIKFADEVVWEAKMNGKELTFVEIKPEGVSATNSSATLTNQINGLLDAMAIFAPSSTSDTLIQDKPLDLNNVLVAVSVN